jgi:hypothetical protein
MQLLRWCAERNPASQDAASVLSLCASIRLQAPICPQRGSGREALNASHHNQEALFLLAWLAQLKRQAQAENKTLDKTHTVLSTTSSYDTALLIELVAEAG